MVNQFWSSAGWLGDQLDGPSSVYTSLTARVPTVAEFSRPVPTGHYMCEGPPDDLIQPKRIAGGWQADGSAIKPSPVVCAPNTLAIVNR